MAEERRLEDMSLKELKQHAKRAGISGYGKMNKEQLLATLTSSPVVADPEPESTLVEPEAKETEITAQEEVGEITAATEIHEPIETAESETVETEPVEPEAKTVEATEAVEVVEAVETKTETVEAKTDAEVESEEPVTKEEPVEEMVKAACPSCKQPVEFPKALFLAGQRPECSNPNCPSNRGKRVQKPVARPTSAARPTPVSKPTPATAPVEIKAAEPRVEKLEEKNGVVEAGTGEHRTYERRGLSKAIAEYFESKGLSPSARKVAGNSYVPRDWNVDLSADIRQEFGRKFSPTLEELLTSKLYFDVYPTMPKHFRADWIKAGLPIFCFDDPSELIDDPQLQQLWIKTGHVRCAEHSEAWNKEVQVQAADGTPRTMSRKWARFNELTGGVPELGDKAIAQRRIEKEAREANNAAKDPLAGIIDAIGVSANRYANETCQVCEEPSVRSQSGDKRDSKLCVSHRNEREEAMAEQKAAHEAKKVAESVPVKFEAIEESSVHSESEPIVIRDISDFTPEFMDQIDPTMLGVMIMGLNNGQEVRIDPETFVMVICDHDVPWITSKSESVDTGIESVPEVVEPQHHICDFAGCQNPVKIEGDVCENCISLVEAQQAEQAEKIVEAKPKSATGKELVPGRGFFQPASDRPDMKEDEMEVVASGSAKEEASKVTSARPEPKPSMIGISPDTVQTMISGAIRQNNLSQKQMVRDTARATAQETAQKTAREEVSAAISKLVIPETTDVDLEAVAKATAEAAAKEAVGIEMRRIEGYLFNTIESEVATRMSGKAADILEKIDSRGYATKEEVAQAIETGYQRIDNAIDRIECAVLSAPIDPKEETTEDNFDDLPLFGAGSKIDLCLQRLRGGN